MNINTRKKNVKQLTLISVLSVLVFGTFVGITRSNMSKLEAPKISKALTMQTHRRVYAYLEGDWTLDQMYIYYWGGSSEGAPTFENPRLMTQVLDNYYEGLFYYDVPVDHTHCLFRKSNGAWDGNHNQSQDALIAHTYVGNNYKAIKVGPWTADGTKRTITYVDTVPMNGNELAQVLSHIQSCSSSYASGYNAWPQLNDLFVTPSTFIGNETVNDNVPPTTIDNKVAMLEQEYQKEHGTGPFACYYSGYSNSTLATYVKMSPNKTSPRPNTLTRITPIVTAETFTAYALGETFYSGGGSGNYGIGTDGTIGLYVNEQDRAWSTGGGGINDNRAITVFSSSDANAEMYADTYNSMVELAADILVRYCKDTLIWFGDKDATLAYEATIADNEMLLTYSEWFRNKVASPWLLSRMGYLATQASTIAKQALINQGCYGEIGSEEPSSEPDVCTYTGFSNSNLTDGNYPNTNFTAKSTQSITEVTRITPMIAGDQYDINTMASVYGTASGVSVNYIIDGNGLIGKMVDEENRAWSTGSPENDHRAVTVAIASDKTDPYAIHATPYNRFIDFAVDLMQRYCKDTLVYLGSKDATLNHPLAPNEMILTVYPWFSSSAPSSTWLINNLSNIATEVTNRLQNPTPPSAPKYPFSNSSLTSVTHYSPNNSGRRTYAIQRITPHCVEGQLTAEGLGNWFDPAMGGTSQASSNYGIGRNGEVGLYVDERNRSWCSSNENNDQRGITIECASDTTHPYAMYDAVYNTLLDLCEDICRRYGKTKLVFFDDKDYSLAYVVKEDEMLITVHRWFSSKSCPGDWLYSRLPNVASTVTARLAA